MSRNNNVVRWKVKGEYFMTPDALRHYAVLRRRKFPVPSFLLKVMLYLAGLLAKWFSFETCWKMHLWTFAAVFVSLLVCYLHIGVALALVLCALFLMLTTSIAVTIAQDSRPPE